MLTRLGSARSNVLDRRLACSLASVAGAVNAAAVYAVGFFSANMTGNVSFLSDYIAIGEWRSALFYCFIIVAFVFGAAVSTLVIGMGKRRGYPGIYALVILLEAVLLACLEGVALWLQPRLGIPALVLGLAFLMGLQNAVVTRISDARVRTTHVSGMATDIGIELALLLDGWRGRTAGGEGESVRGRLRLHLETICSFFVGGVVGVVLYRVIGGGTLWVAAGVLGGIALWTLRRIGVGAGRDGAVEAVANDV